MSDEARADSPNVADPVEFARSLSPNEKMLVTLRDELYEGSWERLLGDLRDRLSGKPFIFKLVNRIEADIAAAAKLSAFEKANGVNLRDLIRR